MSNTKDGGPAFPVPETVIDEKFWPPEYLGMSLRDWFAGQELAGMGGWIPGQGHDWTDLPSLAKVKAEWAYLQADAMLKARDA